MDEFYSGNSFLIDTLHQWGITLFAGVNGGAVLHINKFLNPLLNLSQCHDGVPRLFTMSEYAAGFIPIGYYLASHRIAGCIATTGAATKLISSGISECKLQNIPAVFLVPLNTTFSIGFSPLQDVSPHGMNIKKQMDAELGDGCIFIDSIDHLKSKLEKAQSILKQSRPLVILFHPDILNKEITPSIIKYKNDPPSLNEKEKNLFLQEFPLQSKNRRVILYVCSEAARCDDIKPLITQFSKLLEAPTVWSVNGANAVEQENPYSYGYILFGGNDKAIEIWNSINENDIVITLGFDPGEYSLDLKTIPAGIVWHFTDFPEAYGSIHGEMRHRASGEYYQIRGNISHLLKTIIPALKKTIEKRPTIQLIQHFNTRHPSRKVAKGCVDLIAFYEALYSNWQPHSIGFDDTCIAYKDRQYITQRPHPYITFHSMQNGSAMGASFGLGTGAKLADPSLHTFIFTGDGCWRLFGGSLAEASHLDLRLFILNNKSYGIIKQGLKMILPKTDSALYHDHLEKIDFVSAAKAHGWHAYSVCPDLSNLKDIMEHCYKQQGQSILIDVPVDSDQIIGLNSRLHHLT